MNENTWTELPIIWLMCIEREGERLILKSPLPAYA
jgi:hypothetical protein